MKCQLSTSGSYSLITDIAAAVSAKIFAASTKFLLVNQVLCFKTLPCCTLVLVDLQASVACTKVLHFTYFIYVSVQHLTQPKSVSVPQPLLTCSVVEHIFHFYHVYKHVIVVIAVHNINNIVITASTTSSHTKNSINVAH